MADPNTIDQRILSLVHLKPGWDGYDSPAPHWIAVAQAVFVVRLLRERGLEPTRVAPSAAGGVGITYKADERKAYVESLNDEHLIVLLSDGVADPEVVEFGEGIWDRVQAYLRGDLPVRPPLTLSDAPASPSERPAWYVRAFVRLLYVLAVAGLLGLAVYVSWLLQTLIYWLRK